MPVDAQGNFRHNHESAQMHSQAAGKSYHADKEAANVESGDVHELHPHGDGTFHTVHKGVKTDHPSLGHALIHMAKTHAEEGHTHFHAHHDGIAHVSHHVHAGGESESREHDGIEGVHDHLNEAMEETPTEDEGEGNPDGEKETAGLGELY